MKNDTKMTRRQAVAGLGATLAVAMITPTFGAANDTSMETKKLEDPTKKYPRPPFEEQSQPWPGLAGKMNPRPDHGETSYPRRTAFYLS